MQSRQNYQNKGLPPKDYGTSSQKHDKHGRDGIQKHPKQSNSNNIPKETHPRNVVPISQSVPQITQNNKHINPHTMQPPATTHRDPTPLYNGDYDKYFNEPY